MQDAVPEHKLDGFETVQKNSIGHHGLFVTRVSIKMSAQQTIT